MCFPQSCQCCECQGKMCMMWHPGHSHKLDAFEQALIDNEFMKTIETNRPALKPLHDADDDMA